MASIIIIKSNGSVQETKIRSLPSLSPEHLFNKCGFRKQNGFDLKHTWNNIKISNEKINISLFGRESGKAGHENKYDLPPPVDNKLFFNTIGLVRHTNDNKPLDLSIGLWNLVYEKLFGGFEDLSKTQLLDEMEPDELSNIDDKHKTKNGYLKDGFVVDDSDNLTSPTSTLSEKSLTSSEDEDSDMNYQSDDNSELEEEEYEYENQES